MYKQELPTGYDASCSLNRYIFLMFNPFRGKWSHMEAHFDLEQCLSDI
jgi:hypothetical protein